MWVWIRARNEIPAVHVSQNWPVFYLLLTHTTYAVNLLGFCVLGCLTLLIKVTGLQHEIQCSSDIPELHIRNFYYFSEFGVHVYMCFTLPICAQVRVCTHVYVSLLCIPISFSIWNIVGQRTCWEQSRISARLQREICILLKCQWKLSYFEFLITLQIHRQTAVY